MLAGNASEMTRSHLGMYGKKNSTTKSAHAACNEGIAAYGLVMAVPLSNTLLTDLIPMCDHARAVMRCIGAM